LPGFVEVGVDLGGVLEKVWGLVAIEIKAVGEIVIA
jgi:hypothetical protein